jgi:hypothetical protein
MKPLNFKKVDEAVIFVRSEKRKNNGEVPEWGKYQKLCEEHLRDDFIARPKMPPEYYYAYLREKGHSDEEARVRMGMESAPNTVGSKKKKFLEVLVTKVSTFENTM